MKHWNLTILLVLFTAVFSFLAGYVIRDTTLQPLNTNQTTEPPDISGDILDQQIIAALGPDSGIEAITQPTERYAYTGYVRAITDTTIVVEDPDATTTWPDELDFQLQAETIVVDLKAVTVNGLPENVETQLIIEDLAVNDIITVYTVENILDSETRTATKIQRIVNSEE